MVVSVLQSFGRIRLTLFQKRILSEHLLSQMDHRVHRIAALIVDVADPITAVQRVSRMFVAPIRMEYHRQFHLFRGFVFLGLVIDELLMEAEIAVILQEPCHL